MIDRAASAAAGAATSAPYLLPLGILAGRVAVEAGESGHALPLAGGPLAFSSWLLLRRDAAGSGCGEFLPLAGLDATIRMADEATRRRLQAYLAALTAPRPAFAGLALSRPLIMGVLNVTPDSFSDGGRFPTAAAAITHGRALIAAGADIVDVGGESTRPGAQPVSIDEELGRVVPVLRGLAGLGAVLSIDTRRAVVMREAVAAGARVINDVTALTGDPDSLKTAAESGAAVVLMHMQGSPQTMQKAPVYADVALDVFDVLAERVQACLLAGIRHDRIAVDPGIGFGKTVRHNLDLVERLALFHGLGCALVLGVSRKSFIGRVARAESPEGRLPGSLAAALAGLDGGAQILRVHDVAETAQAAAIWRALNDGAAATEAY